MSGLGATPWETQRDFLGDPTVHGSSALTDLTTTQPPPALGCGLHQTAWPGLWWECIS